MATAVTALSIAPPISSPTSDSSSNEMCRGKLRARHVCAIVYALTCAGPFGVENCVRTFGAKWCLVGFVLTSSVYVLPEIMMTADMSMMKPVCNGGVVSWVGRAFGKVPGAVVALNMIVYQLVDLATYPSLVSGYMTDVDSDGPDAAAMIVCYSVVVMGFVINLLNLEFATTLYMVMACVIMIPFLVGISMSTVNWPRMVLALLGRRGHRGAGQVTDGGGVAAEDGVELPDLNIFMCTMLWLNTGWDSVGNLASEVHSPRCLVKGLVCAAMMCPIVYGLCTFGALAAGPGAWDDGHLAVAYGFYWEPLMPVIVSMGVVSNFLLYAASLACVARLIQALADPDLGLRLFPSILAYRLRGTQAPVAALVAVTAMEVGLISGFSFEYLVQLSILSHVFVFWVSCAAFAQLRFRSNHIERLWNIPGGRFGAACVLCMRVPMLMLLCVSACAVPTVVAGAVAGNVFFLLIARVSACTRGTSVRELDGDALHGAFAGA